MILQTQQPILVFLFSACMGSHSDAAVLQVDVPQEHRTHPRQRRRLEVEQQEDSCRSGYCIHEEVWPQSGQ